MTDKQVGEEWRWCQEEQRIEGNDLLVDAMRALIRKLVEDGTKLSRLACPFDYHDDVKCSDDYHRTLKLSDFGIDPKDYK